MHTLRVLHESWRELLRDYHKGKFRPMREADVQCYLYHLCLKRLDDDPRRIHAEAPANGGSNDLLLENRLPVEIKWANLRKTGRRKPARGWFKDVEKLAAQPTRRRPVVAIFVGCRANRDDTPPEMREVHRQYGPVMKELRLKARGKGIRILAPF